MTRQCTKPKRLKNSAGFKEKEMIAEPLESWVVFDEEHMAFLADNGDTVTIGQASQEIPTPAAFQSNDLGAFDFDCDEAPSASVVLMAKLYLYDSSALLEVPTHDTNLDNEIIEQRVISSTSASRSKPPGNTKNNRISRPTSSNKKNKVEYHLRSVKSMLHLMNVMFDAIHDLCVLDYLNDVNVRVKPKTVKSKKKNVWKPTGNVFTNVGYSWKPTGRNFAIDGNVCPLTRITSTTVVPPKKPLSTIVVKKAPPSSNTLEKLKDITNIVGQFCDSDLEVAFRKHTCYVRNLEGVDLLKGSRGSNFCTISMEEMMKSSLICLLSKASKTKSWLWNRRLSHLNSGAINDLSKKGLVRGLSKLKLHMDLCGPMRIESINEKKYILVIVDDYSQFTWVKFLRSKDETLEIMIKLLKKIQVCLNATVRNIRTDNGTYFVNQTLKAYYEDVGILKTSVARTPQQNGVVKRQNLTLVEVARTMLIFSKALLFLWAEAIATACYTQNRSLIQKCHNKTPYELLHDRKPDLTYFYVFCALCYPTNNDEDPVPIAAALRHTDPTGTPLSTSIEQDATAASTSSTIQET
uniref:Retrovirus-related Pol polyprotein from transposon TNT 1-94 n=1 Tax=Tanacetum cinerariifolium TaxID=118510 RepID=A0A699GTB6_TANCI|nr:retrovirus-related Pol polyprotein from transposon TNT 1-94 [Tanacetum cinerariifolium]